MKRTLKPYVAIGYWEGKRNYLTCCVGFQYSMKDFRRDLTGNAFHASYVMTWQTFNEISNMSEYKAFDKMEKIHRASSYDQFYHVYSYIDQCWDIVEQKLNQSLMRELEDGCKASEYNLKAMEYEEKW